MTPRGETWAAGGTNLLLAWKFGATWSETSTLGAAALLGFLSYGASFVLFVVALRHLGTARTGAYFSVAPFFGALLGVLMLSEPVTAQLLMAGALMAIGVWLHLTELHGHLHTHDADEHMHEHVHEVHHQHAHPEGVNVGEPHIDRHVHVAMTHTHGHFPDAPHCHSH